MERAIVAGALANKPFNGGEAWVRLSWARGLRRLGFDVALVEEIEPEVCVDARGAPAPFEESANRAWFEKVTSEFGFGGRAALLARGSRPIGGAAIQGMTWAELVDFADDAAILVNVSGHLTAPPILRAPRHRAFVDIDPGFTQLWHAAGLADVHLGGHDSHFTIGENIGSADCPIPVNGIRWRPTRQPVVLDDWPVASGEFDRFTTVGSWRGPYGPIEYEGRVYGLKVHEFRKVLPLPGRVDPTLEIALAIDPADVRDRAALLAHGWRLVDPRRVAADPAAFRRYVCESGAEFSVAQGIYVETGCGWLSDRTARYLAAGRPAVVQNTGFSRRLPAGEGLVPFRTLEQAARAIEDVAADYDRHRRAARSLAETWFDSDLVLGRLLEDAGVSP